MIALDVESVEVNAPATRGDCIDGLRPCPWAGCRHHLAAGGSDSCALDVADRGPQELRAIAKVIGMSRESVRLIEIRALVRMKRALNRHRIASEDLSAFAQAPGIIEPDHHVEGVWEYTRSGKGMP